MPAHHRFRLHDHEGLAPLVERAREPRPERSIEPSEPWAGRRAAPENRQLVAKSEVLEGEGAVRPERRENRREGDPEEQQH
jgi:hypothetical protein